MAKPKNPPAEDVRAWIKMYNDGFFLKDIVEVAGLSKSALVHHFKKAGVELRSTKNVIAWDIDKAAQMIQEGESVQHIAKRFNVDPATIREGLKRHRPDIQLNSRLAERRRILEQAAKVAEDRGAPDIAAAIRALSDDES